MKIVYKKISALKNYENNIRSHPQAQLKILSESIEKYGFNVPVVIDKDNFIISWHARVEALNLLNRDEVPVIIKNDLTSQEADEYRILDNLIYELWETRIDKLTLELKRLNLPNIEKLYWLDIKTIEYDELLEDTVPTIWENIFVKKGDIFQLWNHFLMCWDSMSTEDVSKLLKNCDREKVTHCISDPPYWIEYNPEKHWMIKNDDKLLDYTGIAKNYTDWFFCMWTWYQVVDNWLRIVKDTFKKVTNLIIWHKGWWWMGDCQKSLAQDYEILIVCNRWNFLQGGYRWNAVWYSNVENKLDFIEKAHKKELQEEFKNFIKSDSIWRVWKDLTTSYIHPTQKPIDINIKILQNFTKKWDNVLDLFWWSWSNLIACEKFGNTCYMMELDPKYIQTIIKRYHKYTKGTVQIKCLNRDCSIDDILEK